MEGLAIGMKRMQVMTVFVIDVHNCDGDYCYDCNCLQAKLTDGVMNGELWVGCSMNLNADDWTCEKSDHRRNTAGSMNCGTLGNIVDGTWTNDATFVHYTSSDVVGNNVLDCNSHAHFHMPVIADVASIYSKLTVGTTVPYV